MRRKKLFTATLCAILLTESLTAGRGTNDKTAIVGFSGATSFAASAEENKDEAQAGREVSGRASLPEQTTSSAAPTEPSTPAPTEPSTPAPTEPPTSTPTEPSTSAPTEPPTEAPPVTETMPTETTPTEGMPTEPSTSTGPEQSTESSTDLGTETLPSESAPGTETESNGGTQTESASETQGQKESEATETESETSKYKSNEELLANQHIVVPPKIEKEFRFSQVEKRYAVVSNEQGTNVYEKKATDARAVGELEYYGVCHILEDKDDGWYYIESGNVRGFVKAEDVVIADVAQRVVNVKGIKNLPSARLLVARTENEAFEYTHTTAQEVVVDKEYALASGEVKIYEQRKASSRVTGVLPDQALCYILADADKDWIFVESGDARGFVEKDKLITGKAAKAKVSDRGESNIALAQMLVKPEENKACYYTLTSVKKASQAAKTRKAMVEFAVQFVGCPYVWGGTSLTNGADCSGFVQSVYANFGYSLPRVAEAQAGYGMQIPIESAEPGDLIFYARNGYVYHVSMYIGDGRVVQAANRRAGIITSGIGGNAVWATRVITD